MSEAPNESVSALILVVDDDATQRLLVRGYLLDEGFRVEEATNGADGIDLARALLPDLVLLDVMMPGIDGFEVCRQLRADPATGHMPVIIVTGREDTEDIRIGFEAGATDFLTKPVTWNLLPSRIRYVLRATMLEQALRDAKDLAEKARDAKATLLSTMGHELRTPLNAIIGFSDLMRQAVFGPIGSPRYKTYVDDIHGSGTRLLTAINDVLEITDCESGNLEIDRGRVGATDLVQAVVAHLGTEASAAGVRISNEVTDASVHINGDEKRLRHALANLLSNAVRFSEPGGTVRVYMTLLEHDGLTLVIADNGIGISAADLPRVMEPFEQADNRLSRKFEGLGLGIPLARAVFRLHGGDIAYETELGRGTTVTITLPRARLAGERAQIFRTA